MSFLFIILAGICWGLDGLLRSQIQGISPLVIVTLEHLIGFVILAILGWNHLSFPRLSKKAWTCLIGVALFSGVIGTSAFTWAMGNVHYSSFTVLFLLLKLQPLFAITAAFFFLGERPKKSFYPLALLAIVAAYFLSFGKEGLQLPSLGDDTTRAVLAGLVAALCWGSATVFSRYLSHQGYKARTMTAYRLGMVAVLGMVVLIFTQLRITNYELRILGDFSILPSTLYLLLSIALLSGVLGTTLYYRGIRHTPATLASIFELSFPLTGFIIDSLYFHKTFDLYQIIGGIAVIGIMVMIGRKHHVKNSIKE